MKLEIEKHPNGATKSDVTREGSVCSALFWIGILVVIVPLLAIIAALFGIAFAGLWVIEKATKAWYVITKPFRKPKPFRVPQTRVGRL